MGFVGRNVLGLPRVKYVVLVGHHWTVPEAAGSALFGQCSGRWVCAGGVGRVGHEEVLGCGR